MLVARQPLNPKKESFETMESSMSTVFCTKWLPPKTLNNKLPGDEGNEEESNKLPGDEGNEEESKKLPGDEGSEEERKKLPGDEGNEEESKRREGQS